MSEPQSFVETTLPPGYRGEKYGQGWEWHTRAEGRAVFATRAECCRSAWRHWTATVLRGRSLSWHQWRGFFSHAAYGGSPDCCEVWIHASKNGNYNIEAGRVDAGDALIAGVRDVDEAMARFAALVLATEGMVPR
jgi:3',5'-cyclic AMP phosphodiesterase CpdA